MIYPNLFAAMEKGEDVLMVAARLMDGMYNLAGLNCWVSLKAVLKSQYHCFFFHALSSYNSH